MDTKSLLVGILSFIAGGLLVSIAAVTFDKPSEADKMSAKGSVSMQDMSTALSTKNGDDYDKEFLNQMIDHHQGALDMARQSAAKAKHPEIKQLSQAIIEAQEKEIAQMQQWRAQWGYADSGMMQSH